MGNLDFLEKKPRIAYTLSWDGVTEGKVTNTTGSRKVYKISSEEFISRPDIVWTPTGSSSIPCNTPENIRLEKNYHFHNIEDVSNVSVSVLKEDTSKAGYYKFFLMFGDNDTGNNSIDLFYVLVTNKEILSGDFGNVNPTFSEIGWYIGSPSNTEAGDIMSILKDPLVQFSYSGKGFTSPQKPYRYVSRSVKPDDDICAWINMDRMELDGTYFNCFCLPDDFNSEATIELDENLANILKHHMYGRLQIYRRLYNPVDMAYSYKMYSADNGYTDGPPKFTIDISKIDNGNISGLHIYYEEGDLYFNPNISITDFFTWMHKYFSSEP